MNHTSIRIAVILLIFTSGAIVSFPINAGENRDLEPNRLNIIKSINEVLIRQRVCLTINICNQNQFLFVSPSTNGLAIDVFSIHQYATFSGIASVVIEESAKINKNSHLELRIFNISKQEYLSYSFWNTPKPVVSMKLLGEPDVKR